MKFLALALAFLASIQSFAYNTGVVNVNGYVKSNGTYVAPHVRTAADSNPYNNNGSLYNGNTHSNDSGAKRYDSGYQAPKTFNAFDND